jgi:hypothetical protein
MKTVIWTDASCKDEVSFIAAVIMRDTWPAVGGGRQLLPDRHVVE